MLKESQSRSTDLIRGLELEIKALSVARSKDTKYIHELESDLRNRSQEIGYLQDQLNLRNIEANYLGEHVHSLELKLAEVGKLHQEISQLKKELAKSSSDHFFLMRELENKEVDLQNSILCIEKLEEAISSIALESECEIESMKLDLTALEQLSLEAKKFQEEAAHEKFRMDELIEEFEVRFKDSQKMIRCLEKENNELKEKLGISERNARTLCQKAEEYLGEWLGKHARFDIPSCRSELPVSKETGTCEEVFGPLLSKLALVAASDENEKLSHQILKYELLVKQLKDELREEKSKAKEEAEDLTQEMAELRYQITGMLEDECKRRACIEQASLQRIAELEAQVCKEQKKSFNALRRYHEVQKLAESRSMEVHQQKIVLRKNSFQGLPIDPKRNEVCSCGECETLRSITVDCVNEGAVESEPTEVGSSDDDRLPQAAIAWRREETWS